MKKIIFAVLFLCACPGAEQPTLPDGQLEPDTLLVDAKLALDNQLTDLMQPDNQLPDLLQKQDAGLDQKPLPDKQLPDQKLLPDKQLPDQTPPDQAWPPDADPCTGVTCPLCTCVGCKLSSLACRKCTAGKCVLDLNTPPKLLELYLTGGTSWNMFETCWNGTNYDFELRTSGGVLRWFDVKEQMGSNVINVTATNLTTGKAIAVSKCPKSSPITIKRINSAAIGYLVASWSQVSWKLACDGAQAGEKVKLCFTVTTIGQQLCKTLTVNANQKLPDC